MLITLRGYKVKGKDDFRTKKMLCDMSYQSQSLIQPKQKVCEQGKVCANTISSRQIQQSSSSFKSFKHFFDLLSSTK